MQTNARRLTGTILGGTSFFIYVLLALMLFLYPASLSPMVFTGGLVMASTFFLASLLLVFLPHQTQSKTIGNVAHKQEYKDLMGHMQKLGSDLDRVQNVLESLAISQEETMMTRQGTALGHAQQRPGSTHVDVATELSLMKDLLAQLAVTKKAVTKDSNVLQMIEVSYMEDKLDSHTNQAVALQADRPPVLKTMDKQQLLFLVREALQADKIEFLLQPIVSLPQRKPRFYECFSRIRAGDGSIMLPDHYISLAENEGLISAIDNTMLFRCLQLVRKAKKKYVDIGFFCNVSSATLKDQPFMDSFIDFIDANWELAPSLIFEFDHSLLNLSDDAVRKSLKRLHSRKCRFSLDHLEALEPNIKTLGEHNIKYLKIDATHLKNKIQECGKKVVDDILSAYAKASIDIIVTHIENEDSLRSILDLKIDFGQGYHFSPPRLSN